MESEILSLRNLYRYAQADPRGAGLHGRTQAGRAYGEAARDLASSIPKKKGFYLWGRYEDRGLWINIYLGKAGFSKTASLRARILEELKDERWCIWASVLRELEMADLGREYYPRMWGKQYYGDFKRALLKAAASHIIWVATPEVADEDVRNVESDLIETLNPTANRKRPVPSSLSQSHTGGVLQHLRARIHGNRDDRYPTDSLRSVSL